MTLALRCRARLPLGRFDLNVDFVSDVPMLGVLGASGSGKTTLARVLCGLARHPRGLISLGDAVWLDSERGLNVPPERRGVGYVPQQASLFPHLNVRQNMALGRSRALRRGVDFARMFDVAVDILEIRALLDERPNILSGGERQRVALARALCSGPTLLVLDEPFAALDLPLRRRLLPFLRRVREERTVPIVFVTHDPVEAQALCDEVLLLSGGRVEGQGPARRVLVEHEACSSEDGVQNVWPVQVVSSEQGRTRVKAGGLEVHVRGAFAAGEREAWLQLNANQVLIGTELPSGLSAANIWPARVTGLATRASSVLVELDVQTAQRTLYAELAPATVARLDVTIGKPVYAIIKASSCALLGVPARESRAE